MREKERAETKIEKIKIRENMNYYENPSQYQQQAQQPQLNQHQLAGFNDELALRRGMNEYAVQQRAYNELPLGINSNNFQPHSSNNLPRNFYNSRLSAPNQILNNNQANVPTYSMNNLSAPVVSQAPLPVAPIPMQTNPQLPFRPQTSRVMVISRNADNNDLEVTAKKLEKFRVIQNGEREVFRDGVRKFLGFKFTYNYFISLLNLFHF